MEEVDIIPPSTRSRGGVDKLFSEEETAGFNKLFKDLIYSSKSISTKFVLQKLESDPQLTHLVKRFTARQLGDKVRTERRIASKGKCLKTGKK